MGSREGSSAEPEEPVDFAMSFDSSLPVMHSYLGENLEELPGRTVLDDWSYHTLPLLPVKGVVLVPGQTLPLIEAYQPTVKMLLSCIQSDHLFGSVDLIHKPNNPNHLADVGTVAEIYECLSQDNGDSLLVKAIGRQRFRMISSKRDPQGFIKAKIQVLPEIILPDPMAEIRLVTLNRFRCDLRSQRALWRQDAMTATWPSWVYSQYRISSLTERVREILGTLNLGPNTVIPKDPVALSFWLVRAIPLDDEERITILRLNSAIMRLQYVLKIYKKSAILCCSGCQTHVANMTDIFTMSVEGALGTYVNMNGFVHEIITVHKAKSLELQGIGPTAEFSWFPGYAWRIAQCELCLEHIGWRFTALNPTLKPSSFWALAHRSVECISVKNAAVDEDDV